MINNSTNSNSPIVSAKRLNVHYGEKQALRDIHIDIPKGRVTSLIGPSGCGKSTFLRCLNRMNDRIPGFRLEGHVAISGKDIYDRSTDLLSLRRRVGMVFQKPNPFPMTIFENVAIGPRTHYGLRGSGLEDVVVEALKAAAIWGEVKDDFKKKSGLSLSGGQQQRLCIARMLAIQPEIILMDEPCSALDPVSTSKIEELILELKNEHTVVVVTHNLQQAERISDYIAFFMFGELVEHGTSNKVFTEAERTETRDYVSGRFG
jgi:phosphate transport system ATP-binding protein